jgi:hypothetical protein
MKKKYQVGDVVQLKSGAFPPESLLHVNDEGQSSEQTANIRIAGDTSARKAVKRRGKRGSDE